MVTGLSDRARPAGEGRGLDEDSPIMVEVNPAGLGWTVSVADRLEQTLFLSGRQAEEAARRLSLGLAAAGRDSRLQIYDRSRSLIGAYLCRATAGVLTPYIGPRNSVQRGGEGSSLAASLPRP